MRLLLVCLGGGLGSGLRYLVGGWVASASGGSFPFGTLTVNVLGSFLLGLIVQVALATDAVSPGARLFLTTGVMGGFTTYSTFNYETLELFDQGAWLLATANLLATVVGCLVAGLLGLAAGRWWAG
jgi:CrcB protein